MDRHEVAEALHRIAKLLEFKDENPFKVRAFENAAEVVRGLEELPLLVEERRLETVPGIGKAIAGVITELATAGRARILDELESEMPATLPDLLRVPGLGRKKILSLWKELGIGSLDDLETAVRENRLAVVRGFGPKTQERLADGIAIARKGTERWRLPDALAAAQGARLLLESAEARHSAGIVRVEVAGELRRGLETMGEVTFVVACASPDRLPTPPPGGRRAPPVSFVASDPASFANTWLETTGSEEHMAALRAIDAAAVEAPAATEEEIYARLGLAFVPPELREGRGEVDQARRGPFSPLVRANDLRGAFHVHSTWSDGRGSLEEMLRGAVERGWDYVGVSEHSPAAFYARGLSFDRVEEEWKELDALAPKFPSLTVFRGTEADILPDGSIDYGDDLLARFDFVIASVHSAFALPRAEQTVRLVAAVSNPRVTMLGHATGRLLLSRRGIDVDVPAVLAAAGASGCLVEINASPHRMEIDWRFGEAARAAGVFTSINPDAHSVDELDYVRYGVLLARKAGFSPDGILNAWKTDAVTSKLAALRARA